MKKLLSITTIITACIVIFLATSCTKQYVTANNNQTISFNVPSTAWTTPDSGKTYTAVLSTPEITDYFTANGGVLVYFAFTNGVFEQVPEVYQGNAYSYTYNSGSLALYAQSSTGTTVISAPATAAVKLVLVDSSQ